MTIEELDAYIKDYTKNDKTNRAVMLTAPWGSGKTYYIKNELVPSLKKDGIGTILVSLYGIESLAELSKNLYIEARAKWINKKSEKREIGKIIAKTIVKNVVGHYGIDLQLCIGRNNRTQIQRRIDLFRFKGIPVKEIFVLNSK